MAVSASRADSASRINLTASSFSSSSSFFSSASRADGAQSDNREVWPICFASSKDSSCWMTLLGISFISVAALESFSVWVWGYVSETDLLLFLMIPFTPEQVGATFISHFKWQLNRLETHLLVHAYQLWDITIACNSSPLWKLPKWSDGSNRKL